ncbi:MAG TPA: SAM-dependent methyltransferase [Candidatus Omnitrophica bacterium]|nr:MAG: SAM-dependent methyltransferase [Omnitrophica WOR_2 bacterium GWC2_45_7]HBR15738.1 SAM-dependent methyltransferase [Candidatus Omnitrophota bacterium]
MGKLLEIITPLHKKSKRDYLGRMINEKAACSKIAREYGKDFWDGDRRYGYGGYQYDGRWETVAREFIKVYDLQGKANILDVGCGKGFLLYEFKKLLPDCRVVGFDLSSYAVTHAKEEIKDCLFVHRAQDRYPFQNKEFDLVISATTLFNLHLYDLKSALQEIERVGKHKYISVESYRDVDELFNLQCWALTCALFFTPQEWVWVLKEFGYTGDYEFIYFE